MGRRGESLKDLAKCQPGEGKTSVDWYDVEDAQTLDIFISKHDQIRTNILYRQRALGSRFSSKPPTLVCYNGDMYM